MSDFFRGMYRGSCFGEAPILQLQGYVKSQLPATALGFRVEGLGFRDPC